MIRLCEQEARHARLSRRLSVGDAVELFDGCGGEAGGEIAAASKVVVEVAVHAVTVQPRPRPALTLAVAMPKGPRQDVLIEKCTELGVAAIRPLCTERSVAGASDHRRDKWRRTTIEAAKQSGQCWLPELHAPAGLDELLGVASSFDVVLAAMVPRENPPIGLAGMMDVLRGAGSILAFVGPEGGWTPEESRMLTSAQAKSISLGPNVLRIETAAIALAALTHACSQLEVAK
jgi:16S rRNA (uracil1498-N3)-methyltransferase